MTKYILNYPIGAGQKKFDSVREAEKFRKAHYEFFKNKKGAGAKFSAEMVRIAEIIPVKEKTRLEKLS